MARPAFAEREVDAVERGLPARLRDDARRAAEGERAALRLFRETLWPDAARRAEADAPPAMGRFALLDRYRRRYPLSRLIVAVVGNVDPAAVAAALTSAFPAPDTAPPVVAAALAPSPLPAPRGEGKGEGPGKAPAQGPTTVFRVAPGTESSAVVGYPTFARRRSRAACRSSCSPRFSAGRAGASRPRSATNARWPVGRAPACRAPRRPGYLAVTVTCPAGASRRGRGRRARRARARRVGGDHARRGEPRRPPPDRRARRRAAHAYGGRATRWCATKRRACRCWRTAGCPPRWRGSPPADVARAAQAVLDPRREIIAVVHPPSAAPALARTSGSPGRSESER